MTKFKGFTLAEVLITLGIIGVVAAMTMPTLINSTQGAQYKTAYKKALSVLSQAVVMNIALEDYDLSQTASGTEQGQDAEASQGPSRASGAAAAGDERVGRSDVPLPACVAALGQLIEDFPSFFFFLYNSHFFPEWVLFFAVRN